MQSNSTVQLIPYDPGFAVSVSGLIIGCIATLCHHPLGGIAVVLAAFFVQLFGDDRPVQLTDASAHCAVLKSRAYLLMTNVVSLELATYYYLLYTCINLVPKNTCCVILLCVY